MYNQKNLLVAKCAAKPDTHPVLANIHFTPEYTEATDSYMLARVSTIDAINTTTGLYDAKSIVKTMKGNDAVTYEMLTVNKNIVAGEGKYPPVDQIIPAGEPAARVRVNAEYLKTLASIAEKVSDSGDRAVYLELYTASSPIVLRNTSGEGQTFLGLVMPLRGTDTYVTQPKVCDRCHEAISKNEPAHAVDASDLPF